MNNDSDFLEVPPNNPWHRPLLVFQLVVGLCTILALAFAVAVHFEWL